ncbi:hypothetical protein FRC04_008071 [Tulasnella sp. 424]|nr:hypothetical protein FRC04_008071 [Tulasnella sp. 424]KAG8974730.1 hypothetical protein FRC05_006890 [Tulasnella sp. 425]
MASLLQLSYLVTSSIRPRKESDASLLDDDAFGTYPTYGIKPEWANFSSGPQPNNENADYPEYQALYDNSVQNYDPTYNHAPWLPEDQEDPPFNHGASLDASSPLKESSEALIQQGGSNFGKSGAQKNFVRKLYEMLDDKSAQDYIRWNPDGKSFVIDNQDDFAKNVLGRYLKTGNFQSFIRQLNMYDFHKTNKAQRAQRGVQAQAQQFVFSHSKFQKGKPELLSEIKRKGTEQQDPPLYQETMAARIGSSLVRGHLPLVFPQLDHHVRVLLQAEDDRLKQENKRLKADYERLASEHHALKASFRVVTSVPMSQLQNEPSSTALTAHSTFLDGNTSNQSLDSTHHGNLFEFNYIGSPLKPIEGPVGFPQFTGVTVQSEEDILCDTLKSTSLSDPLTSAPPPNIVRTRQRAPEQSRRKERPTSWGEWLAGHLPLGKSQDEAGPSNVNAFSQDTHATHNANYGRAYLGGRQHPVIRVQGGYRT